MRILQVDYMGSVHYHFHRKERDPCYSLLLGLREVIKQFKIDRTLILLEGGKSKYRLSKYPEYKAHRETNRAKWTEAEQNAYKKFKTDANLFAQEVLPQFGLTPVKVWGCEADDIAGFTVGNMDTKGTQILNLSADMDWYQLLQQGVVQGSYPVMMNEFKATGSIPSSLWLSKSAFEKQYEIPVHNWIWKKCLSGDAGDNVKGFNKVGDLTALRLLQKYGSIQGIQDNLDDINIPRMPQAAKESMQEDFDLVYRNYDVMNLKFNSAEELEIFGKDGISYLHDVIKNLRVDKKPLDRSAISEICYEKGWLEVLEPEFLTPFEGCPF